jgi:hypothetical protein
MIISDGSGMQADSMPMRRAMPAYPPAEITAMMKAARVVMILSDMLVQYTGMKLGVQMR